MTIYPDGGVKRLRIVGLRSVPETLAAGNGVATAATTTTTTSTTQGTAVPKLHAVPLNHADFAPYGSVIQSFPSDIDALPQGAHVTFANQGTAAKYHRLATAVSKFSEAPGKGEVSAPALFSVFRCTPPASLAENGNLWEVKILERHRFTTQAFVPMSDGAGSTTRYLVIVALNGKGML
jgi:allantoicase